jgi:hypothetical protein
MVCYYIGICTAGYSLLNHSTLVSNHNYRRYSARTTKPLIHKSIRNVPYSSIQNILRYNDIPKRCVHSTRYSFVSRLTIDVFNIADLSKGRTANANHGLVWGAANRIKYVTIQTWKSSHVPKAQANATHAGAMSISTRRTKKSTGCYKMWVIRDLTRKRLSKEHVIISVGVLSLGVRPKDVATPGCHGEA